MAECSPCRALAFVSTPEQRLCRSCYGNRSIRLISLSLPNIQPPWRRVQPLRLSCDSGSAEAGQSHLQVWICEVPREKSTLWEEDVKCWYSWTLLSWKTSCEPTQQKSVSRLGGNTSTQLLVFSSVEAGPSFCSLPHPEVFLQYFSENTGLFHHESQLSGSKAKRSQTPLAWSSISNNPSFDNRLKLLISRSPS